MRLPRAACVAFALPLIALAPPAVWCQTDMDEERLSKIPVRMQEFVDEGVISGAVMLLARHGDVVLLEAVGYRDRESRAPMHTDSIFQIASMTKPVTAVGIMILLEEGRLRLNDPVEMYLPEFRHQTVARSADGGEQPEGQRPLRPITIRDLLTHTSGMSKGPPMYSTPAVPTLAEVVALSARQPLEFEPGTSFLYGRLGMETLGRIIEVVSGRPYEEFMPERIFHPLGMKDSFFFPQSRQCARVATIYVLAYGALNRFSGDPCRPSTYPNPAGGMFSTAADMFAFYQMTLEGGRYDGARILSRASVDAMTAPHVSVPPGGNISARGLGWWVVDEPVGTVGLPLQSKGSYGHAGWWGTIGWVDPKTGLVGVFLIHHRSDDLPRKAFAELFVTMATAAIAN